MWITVDVERVLRVDRGINVILCNPMLGSGGPQTLVLKLKGKEMTDEVHRLRSVLESIADWRNVNISGEYEHGLRDIIRSIVDCAVAALDSPTQRPASQAAPTREEFLPRDAWNELVHKDDRTSPDDYPDMCLISIDELKDYMERHTRPAPQEVRVPESVGIEEIIDLIRGEFPLTKDHASARRLGCAIRDRYTVARR